MKVPSVALLEEVEQVYPNPRYHRKEYQGNLRISIRLGDLG